jgi:hypothetical protein
MMLSNHHVNFVLSKEKWTGCTDKTQLTLDESVASSFEDMVN